MVTADPRVAPAFDELKIEFSEPISQRAVSEIFPTQVAPGAVTEFSLFFRLKDTKITVFDRLYLEAPTSIRFSSALLNDIPVAVEDAVNESGFEVTFPQLLGDDNLVELRFTAHIFQQSTPFNLFIQDSRDGSNSRQRVDSGDATDRVLSSTNLVRLPVKPDLLLNVTFDSLVLTPNGDGINDAIAVQTDIVNILVPRPLRLRLYDLAGRQLTERPRPSLLARSASSGTVGTRAAILFRPVFTCSNCTLPEMPVSSA